MPKQKSVLSVFGRPQPIIGLIHLKGENDEDVFNRAKNEIELYHDNGIDAILVENYYGHYYHMEMVLDYLRNEKKNVVFGVNCLNLDALGFELAAKYGAKFVQFDSVVGHVKPRDDYSLDAFFKLYRERYDVFVLGGVRFKYQPVLSIRSVEEDLRIACSRCDAIVVTQDATGQETSLDKIKEFRQAIGDFPLFVGAGVTPSNCDQQLKLVDGAIIGSYFKDTYKDSGEVCKEHVTEIVDAFNLHRKEGKYDSTSEG